MIMELDRKTRETVLQSQENEITEYRIYRKLAKSAKTFHNRKVLNNIAKDEFRHYKFWKKQTGEEVGPSRFRIWKYTTIARVFGLTFGVKLMESGEEIAQDVYGKISEKIPGAKKVLKDEEEHEKKLTRMIDEERLEYVGSIVLGLNDALVELTGALAGFTLALANAGLIAVVGLITGIAASMSMGASEYLSTKAEKGDGKDPKKASLYTFLAYLVTVLILVTPFFLLSNPIYSLVVALVSATVIILVFTFYVSVANELPFRRRFLEMVLISLGIAGISFVIGFLIKIGLGIDV